MNKSVSSLPAWFQRWGIGAWLIVGILLVVVGLVWLLEQTSSIVDPLIAGFVVSAVSGVARRPARTPRLAPSRGRGACWRWG